MFLVLEFRMRLAFSVLLFFVAYAVTEKLEESPAYYPFYGPSVLDRRFFATTTATTVSTLVSTVTCTKKVAACGGRRRRGLLLENDESEQFVVSPSAVQG